MGQVAEVLPQGKEQHCGNPEHHPKHTTPPGLNNLATWCSGVPVLPSFVEVTIRVPLPPGTLSYRQMLRLVGLQGLGWLLDQVNKPGVTGALRLRWAGEDRSYPLRWRGGGHASSE